MVKYGLKLQKIGEILKDKRMARGLEFSQISEIIKIRGEYLKALENSDYTVFPSEVQAKGFLKKYSSFLNIDEEKALALYRRERETVSENIIKSPSVLGRGPRLVLTPGKLVGALIVGTVLAVLFYIGSQIQEVVKAPALVITAPSEVASGEEETITVESEEITIEGEIQVGSTLTLNGNEVATNNLEKFTIPSLSLKEGENKFVLVAESQFGRETQVTLNVIKDVPETAAMQVKIVPQEALFLTIVSDNEQILNANVPRTDPINFVASEIFTVKSTKLSKITLEINGQIQTIGNETTISFEINDGVVTKL